MLETVLVSIANRHKECFGLLEFALLCVSMPEGLKSPTSLFFQPSECKICRKLYADCAYMMLGMFLVCFCVAKRKRKNYSKRKISLVQLNKVTNEPAKPKYNRRLNISTGHKDKITGGLDFVTEKAKTQCSRFHQNMYRICVLERLYVNIRRSGLQIKYSLCQKFIPGIDSFLTTRCNTMLTVLII